MKGKGKILILLLVCLIIVLSLVMVACNKNKNSGSSTPEDPGTVIPGKDINFNVYFYILPTDTEPYATLEIKSGNKVKASDIPDNPSRNGYKFGGWYKTTSFSPGDEFNPNSVIGKDIKLYAYWIAPFTITFYEDLYDGVVYKTITRYSDETVLQNEIYTPEKTNYEFGGWYLNEDCTQPYVYSEHLTESLTLYAKWISTYAKLQFITNIRDLKIDTKDIKKAQEYKLPVPEHVPEGATFEAWCTDKELLHELSNGTIIIIENTIVYAKWTFDHQHTFENISTIVKQPNCTENGIKANCCSICGYYNEAIELPALGHNFNENVWFNGGTYHYHKCTQCEEELGKQAHDYLEGVITINPTCTEMGQRTYKCKLCNASKVEDIVSLGHNVDNENWSGDETRHWHICINGCEEHFDEQVHQKVRDESKDHTSTSCAESNVVGWKCSVCNVDLSEVSPAKEHTIILGEYEYNETQHWQVCNECGNRINLSNHNFVDTKVKGATCLETGITKHVCSECGYEWDEIIPKTAHNLFYPTIDSNIDYITDEQRASLEEYHFTCCQICHRVFYESKEKHYVDWENADWYKKNVKQTTKPTCTTEGYGRVDCVICRTTHNMVIPALGHDWDEGTKTTEPTCTTNGIMTHICQRSGCEATKTVTIPAAHNYVLVDSIPYSCTKDGQLISQCTYCGDRIIEIDPARHTYTNYLFDETHHWIQCIGECGKILEDEPHDFEMKYRNEPTSCEDIVWRYYECKKCGYYTPNEAIEGLGHKWDEGLIISEPSCTEPGYREYTCQNIHCGKIKTETFGEPLGHSWDEGTITTPATCIVPGVKTYICTRDGCGATRTEAIPTIDHEWNVISKKPASCTETGLITYKCHMCKDTKTEVIQMVPHEYEYGVEPNHIKPPTCTEDGEDAFYCKNCGQRVTQVVQALGHSWNDGAITTAPTCTSTGVKTYTCTRDGCGATRTEPVSALGHDYHDAITAPTCTEKGYTTHTCSRCEDSYKDTYVGALGHSWNDGVITTAPTCTSTGVKTYICTRDGCGTTKTEPVPMTPHTYGSTWTHYEEYDELQCEVCGHVKETRAHDYDGYCCKYCHHYLLEKYVTDFETNGSIGSSIIIESEDEFILFLDYILSRHITTNKYFKFGGDFATELRNQGKNLTLVKTYNDIIAAYQNRVTMPVPAFATTDKMQSDYSIGIKWYLTIDGNEVNHDDFISTDEGIGYGTFFYNTLEDWYQDINHENLPQQDYYFNEYSSSRTNSFDDFKYKEYTTGFDCVTSDQVVFALEHYMKPVCTGRALNIVNRAKSILRGIVDDDMSDYEKVKAIYKWVVSNVTYDNAVLNPNNLYGETTENGGWIHFASWFAEGALDYGYAVCDGISKAFVILTGLEGIRSVRISSNTAAHAWNKVFIDTDADGVGEWYVVDATWGNLGITGTNIEIYDASHFLISDAQKAAKGCVGDNYLDIEATTTYNYYVTETFEYNSTTYDLVIESAEESQILKSYMLENNTKTTTYKTISIFIVGTNTIDLVPAGVSYVDGMEVTIGNVQGKYYILIIS